MKLSKSSFVASFRKIPEINFVDPKASNITSFGGLIIFDKIFRELEFLARLKRCFSTESVVPMIGFNRLMLWMMLHLILGYRQIRDVKYYEHDPMVLRILGLKKMPYPTTLSRSLNAVTQESVDNVRSLMTEMVIDRISQENLARITLDFDGSVISTSRYAEGTAVGYNKKKKGQRSYYPLFCTVSQTGQFFDMLHRPGNVHDSNGADEFISQNVDRARKINSSVVIETRMDSAFFSEKQLDSLNSENVEFTVSVPFERFTELKSLIEERKRWRTIDDEWSYFEPDWRPKSWVTDFRFVIYRRKVVKQRKGVLQLHLFEPRSFDFEYKVVVSNKRVNTRKILKFHNGRGSQEGIFGDAKGDCKLEYVPVRSLTGNQLYCLAGMMAHNTTRELQMRTSNRHRGTTEKRSSLWIFQKLSSIRKKIVQRAAKLVCPQRKLTLIMAADGPIKKEIETFLALAS